MGWRPIIFSSVAEPSPAYFELRGFLVASTQVTLKVFEYLCSKLSSLTSI